MLEAAAQVFVFFIAGFETTSTTLTYCLHELAKFPHVQEKLQEEIDKIANTPDGFNYENVMNMKYLDMVFNGNFDMFQNYGNILRLFSIPLRTKSP